MNCEILQLTKGCNQVKEMANKVDTQMFTTRQNTNAEDVAMDVIDRDKIHKNKTYSIIPMKDYKNSLFRCFAFFEFRDQEKFDEIKTEILCYAADNWEDIKRRCPDAKEYETSLEYIQQMDDDGQNCGRLEISIFTVLCEMKIVLCMLRDENILLNESTTHITDDKLYQYMIEPFEDGIEAKHTHYLLNDGEWRKGCYQALEELREENEQREYEQRENDVENKTVLESNISKKGYIEVVRSCDKNF